MQVPFPPQLTAQSADLDLALERDQRAQGFVNHLALIWNAGQKAGALNEFTVNVNINMHIVAHYTPAPGAFARRRRGWRG